MIAATGLCSWATALQSRGKMHFGTTDDAMSHVAAVPKYDVAVVAAVAAVGGQTRKAAGSAKLP
jgi:hypothetical protein